jgi:hypothetical protein
VSITSTPPGSWANPHVHALPVFADGHVVGVAAQRNLLDDLEGLRVGDVERALASSLT